MTRTVEDYAQVYRQKQQDMAAHKRNIESIRSNAESAIKAEADAIKRLDVELRHMQKVITIVIETGKDLTEVLLAESDDKSFAVTLWDHDNPFTNDTQIEYTEQQLADFKHQARNAIRS